MTDTSTEDSPYQNLNPDVMFAAVESCGIRSDGRFLALNSYENRVYQIGVEDSDPVVAKFYRPGRWNSTAIEEEHAFSFELAEQEIPVVPPWRDSNGKSLHEHSGFRFALYPRQGGRWPDLEHKDHRIWIGRLMARMHLVGSLRPFTHRPTLDIQTFGTDSYRFLLESDFLPAHIETAYRTLVEDLLTRISAAFDRAGAVNRLRLHGDCHPGNILWTDDGPHFVDLDDCRMGPAMQDLWMLLSGDTDETTVQLSDLLTGYHEFADFDMRELHLIEALRTIRMIHYAAWLARRWQDPAFPKAFPWFNTPRYWDDHILSLREQAALMDEPPLTV